ncbi:hypothetical protein FLK61_28650 [Paenalkalicoccus suaedae]|uniref:Uncharacterized protein n=1 Tax=Paenalkalicoccus suaedae TaxID=2592382 RepID=A0A859FCQ1_9BACI|nr:hypothetical protein [Paenalkalicoccus suaedae]QKS70710.1 hypothetical protein FLK61_28650 [Paenalkalicoccus suaedae]
MIRHYLYMWLAFTVLFTSASVGLEIMEGNKVTTTAYYGLRNLGIIYIIFTFIHGFIIYPLSFFPLSLLINKLMRPWIIRMLIFIIVASLGAVWVFNQSFVFSGGSYIDVYELNMYSSVIIFGIAGLVYALINEVLKSKTLGV